MVWFLRRPAERSVPGQTPLEALDRHTHRRVIHPAGRRSAPRPARSYHAPAPSTLKGRAMPSPCQNPVPPATVCWMFNLDPGLRFAPFLAFFIDPVGCRPVLRSDCEPVNPANEKQLHWDANQRISRPGSVSAKINSVPRGVNVRRKDHQQEDTERDARVARDRRHENGDRGKEPSACKVIRQLQEQSVGCSTGGRYVSVIICLSVCRYSSGFVIRNPYRLSARECLIHGRWDRRR